jgi:uncharacterized SAM-dependent methyltransferase
MVLKMKKNKNNGMITQDPNVNDLLFKELIKRGYSLEGNTRVWNIADSKLWYLTPEQAQAYLDWENSYEIKEKGPSQVEKSLVHGMIKHRMAELTEGPLNIIDLGCGDGKKAMEIIKMIGNKTSIKYCPIDISGYMVKKAIANFTKLNVGELVLGLQYNISDFENLENLIPLLSAEGGRKNLFLMLGGTLGNFEVDELLYAVRSAMNKGDFFLASIGVKGSKWEVWAEKQKHDKRMDKFFGLIPIKLGLGVDEVEFGSRFKNSRVEYYYKLLKDKTAYSNNRKVEFHKGDQIIVAVAYKFNEVELLERLHLYFGAVQIKLSEDGSLGILLAGLGNMDKFINKNFFS